MGANAGETSRGAPPFPRPVNGNGRALAPEQVLVLGFAGAIAIGTVVLSLPVSHAPGKSVALVDAFFTAVSAVCVTGLVTVDTRTTWSTFGHAVILLLMQVGGLGIMTTSTLIAFLRGKRITLPERLVMQEALGQLQLAGVVRLARSILLTTLLLEAAGAAVLALRWARDYQPLQALWYGVFHSVSAFNNAGFDLFSISMIGYREDPTVSLSIPLLIILGGLGFVTLTDIHQWLRGRLRGQRHELSVQTRMVLVVSGVLILLGTLFVLVWEHDNPETLGPLTPHGKLLAAFFQGTVPRTAGFNSVPIGSLRDATLFFMIMLMFVGASPGGTGGGVKTTTFGVVALAVWSTIRGRSDVELFGRRLGRQVVDRSLAIVASALFLITTVILILAGRERAPLLPIMFEVFSAFGTVGLSTGLTPHLSLAGKLIIAATMFAGRVGPLTLAVALARIQGRGERPFRYPEERVMVG